MNVLELSGSACEIANNVAIADELVLVSMPAQNTEAGMDTVPNADEEGKTVVNNEVRGDELVAEIKKAVERPAIIDLLRKIR